MPGRIRRDWTPGLPPYPLKDGDRVGDPACLDEASLDLGPSSPMSQRRDMGHPEFVGYSH